MRKTLYAIVITALALGWTATAHAQAEHYRNKPIELNVHAGLIFFDDIISEDAEPEIGARVAYNMANGVGIGGNFDWSQVTIEGAEQIDGDDVNMDIYLYSAELDYTFASTTRLHSFVGAGVGAATFSPDFEGSESETELLIPLAAGIKWFNRTNDPTWAFRAELRDNVIFASADEETVGVFGDDETLHNIELSGGISFFLGGGM